MTFIKLELYIPATNHMIGYSLNEFWLQYVGERKYSVKEDRW